MQRRILLILGPTGVGKTAYSIEKALEYGSPIISCDSRQIYKEMPIGTAAPSIRERRLVRHYFVRDRSVTQTCTAGDYELEAIALVDKLFAQGHETLIMTGGSMLWADAFCYGLDDFPTIPAEIRTHLMKCLESEGLPVLADELRRCDPDSFNTIDINNPQRVIRALEVTIFTGAPFSSFKTAPKRQRNFEVEKIGLRRDREVLYRRIDERVDLMFKRGLMEEARRLYDYRGLPALQTVGYRELFEYFSGQCTLDAAIGHIKRATHNYAKRQMTWWKRDSSIRWIDL